MFIKSIKINKSYIVFFSVCIVILASIVAVSLIYPFSLPANSGNLVWNNIESNTSNEEKKYIKWVDFNVTYDVLDKTSKLDITSHTNNDIIKYNWIELLSYLACKYGGNFKKFKQSDLTALTDKLKNGSTMEELTKDLKNYNYYYESYDAILHEFIGEYEVELPVDAGTDEKTFTKKYGVKAFLPIAKNYSFSHYDDFGNARSYGFKRVHLGNDLMGSIGTPIIAVESGTVEALGWNQYGGWRIGVRSMDRKRYYYYAHLRKDHPYTADMYEGKTVKAGDVIGYLGMTGYSTKENVNNINIPHLHFGMQLIFDESQKDGVNQIWIDVYQIIEFLRKNKSEIVKENNDTKDYTNVNADALDDDFIKVPIIMYHSILKSKSGDYIIHPNILEKDLAYIKGKGYTSITIQDLINYVYENSPLPEKPIIITFDDGHYNNLTYALPILKKYDMKAVISIVGEYTNTFTESDEANPNYGYLRWKDINELIADGTIEFQNHTYNLHSIDARKGCMKKKFESKEDYETLLTNDLQKLQEEFIKNTNYTPNTFTYPFGAISKDSLDIIKKLGFKASLSCEKGVNHITKSTDCLYCLKRNNRPSNISTESFFKNLLE